MLILLLLLLFVIVEMLNDLFCWKFWNDEHKFRFLPIDCIVVFMMLTEREQDRQ